MARGIENSRWRAFWLYGAIAVCLLLLAATLATIRDFSLRDESNFAALWSGMLLLLTGFHAFDGWASNRSAAPSVARAWLMISLVMVTLSMDEIGSLHERLPSDSQYDYWPYVLPIALAYASISAYALVVLYRSEEYRRSARLIGLGFLLFGSVALQEELEWILDWPAHLEPLRAAVEEGTELAGMILILKASMANTRGRFSRDGRAEFPVFEAVRAWRRPLIAIGLVGAPVVAFLTVRLPPDPWGHGLPANWPPAAIFLLAALGAIRPFLSGAGAAGWTGWTLAGLCLVGCARTTVGIGSHKGLILMGMISALAGLIWILDSRYAPRVYLPAVVFLAAVFGVANLFFHSFFVLYASMSYLALAFYHVISAAEPIRR